MMNSRELLRWLVTGFLFGTGWEVAKLVWGVLASFTAILLPVLVVGALGWMVFLRLRPVQARHGWQQALAWLASTMFWGRGRGGVRAQVFRHR